ncbi:hypothetical protein WICMUC_003836 [Wickerhamomyces mucosus]|uniref:AAA+ ATPase domain-containing protein n=1 Tax=Wickerhamomyces mucosus TaxID=1378264 RepID=A0A9P8TBB1_9ASCO|nr:hypothetical protein WICMUC_003836 [Wickerhamomyces mucosus]
MSKFKIDIKLVTDIALFVGASISAYYMMSHLLNQEGPAAKSSETKRKAKASLQRLKQINPDLQLELDDYENAVLASVVTPFEIDVGFNGKLILYRPELFNFNSLLKAPKGVLLYGPPGCGKTMLAKALAKESGANFISIRMSQIMDKWYGESNKMVDAIFSLGGKLQPCIIFIDEIDSFLRERQSMDHEVTAMLKAEFMTLWDGLTSSGRILVLGATNRPNDIDAAFLRRMPKRFSVTLPNEEQRKRILTLNLKDSEVDPDSFDLNLIVTKTIGFSGSDLKELCRDAAMTAMREYIKYNFRNGQRISKDEVRVRPLKTSDFIHTITNHGAVKSFELDQSMISTLD